MSIIHEHYSLKHSFYSAVFHVFFMLIISITLLICIELIYALGSIIFILIIWWNFRKKPQLKELQKIDKDLWSIQMTSNLKIYQAKLNRVFHFHYFVVLSFNENKFDSLVIWRDQIDEKQWKSLITHASFG
ncbi:hypothetical protein SAMN05216500_11241 [Acinetobacter sp. DSM 11652]|nr:hypothetical protein SAMN05216500_11241 [Acinetobacter sp. DSM 11652]